MGGIVDAIRKYAEESKDIEWHEPANSEFYKTLEKIFENRPGDPKMAHVHYTLWAALMRITPDEALEWLDTNATQLPYDGWYEVANTA